MVLEYVSDCSGRIPIAVKISQSVLGAGSDLLSCRVSCCHGSASVNFAANWSEMWTWCVFGTIPAVFRLR